MKRALTLVVAILLVPGCGHSATVKDPFVGTWLVPKSPDSARLVIARHGSRYLVLLGYADSAQYGRWGWFVRRGDALVLHLRLAKLNEERDRLSLDGAGRLRLSTVNVEPTTGKPLWPAVHVTLSKLSESSVQPTPSSSPSAAFTVATKGFDSPALGISFRYPASWRLSPPDPAALVTAGRAAALCLSPRDAKVKGGVYVTCTMSIRVLNHKSPPPFMDALLSAALGLQKSDYDHIGFVRIDGLRLLSAERDGGGVQPLWATSPWRMRVLASRMATQPPWPSQVEVWLGAPISQWGAAEQTLDAIQASMRFSTPKGQSP